MESHTGMPALPPAGGGGGGGGAAASNVQPRNINLNAVDGGGGGGGGAGLQVREQDRFLPIANVIRIMRKVLPSHAKISDDAKETIQECVSEYISFVTSEANERCQREQRRTITAEDVLWAMTKLGFDDYVEPLSFYLHRYREIEGDNRGLLRGDTLPRLKRSHSEVGTSATAALYGGAPPPPPPSPPAPATHQMAQMHHGMYGDDVTGYYMDVYGDTSGAGSSSSSQRRLMRGGSDPSGSRK